MPVESGVEFLLLDDGGTGGFFGNNLRQHGDVVGVGLVLVGPLGAAVESGR